MRLPCHETLVAHAALNHARPPIDTVHIPQFPLLGIATRGPMRVWRFRKVTQKPQFSPGSGAPSCILLTGCRRDGLGSHPSCILTWGKDQPNPDDGFEGPARRHGSKMQNLRPAMQAILTLVLLTAALY